MNQHRIKLLLAVICLVAAGMVYLTSRSGAVDGSRTVFIMDEAEDEGQELTLELYHEVEEMDGQLLPEAETRRDPGAEEPVKEEKVLYVHVCGQVVSPGVYGMAEGSRIYEAVEQAGGFTEEAASDFLNLAQLLEDGMKLTVPDKESVEAALREGGRLQAALLVSGVEGNPLSGKAGDASTGKVNINTASKEQLMALKGIGAARAEDIISYRQDFEAFQKIEDIMKVPGIKEAAFQKIKDDIIV